MKDDPFSINIAEETFATRSGSGRGGGPWLILFGLALVLILGGGIFLFWPRKHAASLPIAPQRLPPGKQPDTTSAESLPQILPVEGAADKDVSKVDVADDGKTLWASPTAGKVLDCSYLLPGTQLIFHVRVAELLAHAEGEKVLTSLGPWGEYVTDQLTRATKNELSSIETLLFGIRPTRDGELEFAVRIRLRKPLVADRVDEDYFLPSSTDGTVLVGSSPSAADELQMSAGDQPQFSRELDRVLQETDASRMTTLVFAGKFLQLHGEKFLRGSSAPLQEALANFLGDEATASAFSLHWDENFFLELQSTVVLSERPHRFAASLLERVDQVSDQMEDSIFAAPLHPYGRKVLGRFPAMLRKLSNYTRSGENEGLSVLRCYLPVNAGHNLVMASELLLNLPTSTRREGTTENLVAKKSIRERLRQTTSLVFPKETLQRSLEMLSEDLGVPIEIVGSDLQLEGITKNQSFAIELRGRPAGEILLAVLMRANPDRTANGPKDTKQKLVYYVRQPTDKQAGAVVVTTRAAAARRGEKLPEVFRLDSD